ncbi:MAG: RNA polymerase sigma factor [Lachnospiraceae bacterium]|nr:RNA polymerase sigma factor [Lachnospiraceae bacterium]
MRSEQEANRAIGQYADTVRRICMLHLKSYSDTEDIFQNVFLKYVLSSVEFTSEEHEKAWIIRVTINACKDLLKSFFHSKTVSYEQLLEEQFHELQVRNTEMNEENKRVLESVLTLPVKYKDVVYLYYYEEYTAVEIAKMLGKNVNTVYTLLARAKELLREKLGGDILA